MSAGAFFGRVARVIAEHRVVVIVLFALAFALATHFGRGLAVDFRPSAVFLEDDPAARAFQEHQARWGRDDMLVAVVAHVDDDALLTPARVGVLADVARALAALPFVRRSGGLLDVPVPHLDDDGALAAPTAAALVVAAGDDEARRARARALVAATPGVTPALLAADGRAGVLFVELDVVDDDIGPLRPMLDEIERVLDGARGREGVSFAQAGVPAARAAFLDLTLRDQARLVPLALIVVAALLLLIFRSLHGVVIPAIAAFSPLVFLVAAMRQLDEPVGLVNQVYFTLIPAIAVADAIHVVHRMHEARRATDEPRAALVETVTAIGPACLLTSATTAIGFASLGLSRIGVLRHFGWFAALGVLAAFVVVVVLVPPLLSMVKKIPAPGTTDGLLERALDVLARVVLRHRALVLVVTLVVLGAPIAVFAPRVVVDNELTGLVPEGEDAAFGNHLLNERLGGILTLGVELASDDGRPVVRAEVLRAMHAVTVEARALPGVRSAWSLADLYAATTPLVLGRPGLTVDDAERAQVELVLGDPPALRALVRDGKTRIVVGVVDDGGRGILARAAALDAAARAHLAPLGVRAVVGGRPVAVYTKLGELVRDLRVSLGGAILAILVSLLVFFRSPRLLLACIPSNVLPILAGYATLGAVGWPLDLGPAVILTIAFGISVDDTIHVADRFRAERGRGAPRDEAVVRALTRSGRAVVVTSVILVAAFLLQTLSSFQGILQIGLLGAVVVVVALIADLLVLPPLLSLIGDGAPADPSSRAARR